VSEITNLNIVLHEPEIPNNTGNIGRTCVGANARLHLIEPLGFEISDKHLKRSGLDYWPHLDWYLHQNWDSFLKKVPDRKRLFFFTTKTEKPIYEAKFERGDWLVFGKETKGLPPELLKEYDAHALTLPMYGEIRSYNLANTVAVATFEVLRQLSAKGQLAHPPKKR
jgi:tRNA (cytidine/uridine-2'-O-)-methyltransferase